MSGSNAFSFAGRDVTLQAVDRTSQRGDRVMSNGLKG